MTPGERALTGCWYSSCERVGPAAALVAEGVEAKREEPVSDGDVGDLVAVWTAPADPEKEAAQVLVAEGMLGGRLDQDPAQPS